MKPEMRPLIAKFILIGLLTALPGQVWAGGARGGERAVAAATRSAVSHTLAHAIDALRDSLPALLLLSFPIRIQRILSPADRGDFTYVLSFLCSPRHRDKLAVLLPGAPGWIY